MMLGVPEPCLGNSLDQGVAEPESVLQLCTRGLCILSSTVFWRVLGPYYLFFSWEPRRG